MERLQQLGKGLGMSTGVDEVHWLLDTALTPAGTLSDAFLGSVVRETGFDSNPLYAVLQEVIYHQGVREPGWAAQAERDRWPSFDPDARPLQLTGETIFPWMYEQHAALRPFRAAAEALAARTEWPALYDLDRLAANEVPVAAVQYYDDPYVDLDLALATARRQPRRLDHQRAPARRAPRRRRHDPAQVVRPGSREGARHRPLSHGVGSWPGRPWVRFSSLSRASYTCRRPPRSSSRTRFSAASNTR